MKNIIYSICALIIISSIFTSCRKDNSSEEMDEKQFSEITTDFNQLIELREDDFCLEVPELCPRVGIIHEPVPYPVSVVSSIVFKDGDKEYLVKAIESPRGSKAFAVISKEQTIVISDTENEIYTRFSDNTIEVPDCIYQVFEMDYQKWTDGELTEEDVRGTYEGRPVYEDSKKNTLVIEDSFLGNTDPDCPPAAKLINNYFWCSYRISATTNAIQKHLMAGLPASVVNATKFTVRQAVADCAPPAPDCFGCIDQSCILDALKESLGTSLTKRMRENYLKLYLRLTDAQFAELKNNEDLFNEYLEYYGLKSPVECEGDCLHATSGAIFRLESLGLTVTQPMIDRLCSVFSTLSEDNYAKYECLRNLGTDAVDLVFASTDQDLIDLLLATPCNYNTLMEALGLQGQDWFYDEDFWENPDLQIPSVELPSWADVLAGIPKDPSTGGTLYGASNIYESVGGAAKVLYDANPGDFGNVCAIKVCMALNAAGVDIPEISNGQYADVEYGTVKGADDKNYFLNANSLAMWMRKAFGTDNNDNYHFFSSSVIEPLEELHGYDSAELPRAVYTSMKGLSMTFVHADIYNGSCCTGGCSKNSCFLSFVTEADFWELD